MSAVDKSTASARHVAPTGQVIDITMLSATERLAQVLARQAGWLRGKVVYLHGDLGVGKTTLARFLLHALGETGKVKSPTYGLMESYQPPTCTVPGLKILHLDLYRLQDAEELEYLGLRDLLDADTVLLVEWPERGQGVLPAADVLIELTQTAAQRSAAICPQALADALMAGMQNDV